MCCVKLVIDTGQGVPDSKYDPRGTEEAAVSIRTHVRHRRAPAPNGCRWCGREERSHGLEWAASVRYHNWSAPTAAQRRARMVARRVR